MTSLIIFNAFKFIFFIICIYLGYNVSRYQEDADDSPMATFIANGIGAFISIMGALCLIEIFS